MEADFASGMVARLRERIAAAHLVGIAAEVMDGQALALPDAAFDVAVSVLGLIFFPDTGRGLAEMRRVLRPGGRAAGCDRRRDATSGRGAVSLVRFRPPFRRRRQMTTREHRRCRVIGSQ